MAVLPPTFLDAVVAIGTQQDDGTFAWLATGFVLMEKLVESFRNGDKRYRSFIVTNRHVLAGLYWIALRFNPEGNEPAKEYTVSLATPPGGDPRWFPHPNKDIDIAVMPFCSTAQR